MQDATTYFLNKSIGEVGEGESVKSDVVIKGTDFFTLVALDEELSREPTSFEGKLASAILEIQSSRCSGSRRVKKMAASATQLDELEM